MMRRFPFNPSTLRALCAVVGRDAWQRAPAATVDRLYPHDVGPPNAASAAVLRMFLRALYPPRA